VGVIGAGRWATAAHLPGLTRSPLCEVVVLCDLDRDLAKARAEQFDIPEVETDYERLLSRPDIDVIDVVTRGKDRGESHQELTFAALEAGKHVLCEKPVCHDYRDIRRAHELAVSKKLKTKVGLTFRYAPAVMYMQALIADGFVGRPFIFNGFEQNSQWIDPDTPMDKRPHKTRTEGGEIKGHDPHPEAIQILSLEGYGAPIIDIGLMSVGSDLHRVIGTLKNMIPSRRRTNLDTERERINVDDADIFIGECENGAAFSVQSSYVTVGNYPGIEARIYGADGALVCRLVDEFGECEMLHGATPDAVEFVRMPIPQRFFPPGVGPGEPWPSLFYGNLVHTFMQELSEGTSANQGNFGQSAKVQEVINAVALSHRERRWVDLPLPAGD
jgi:predicted dehydrogenase